MVLIVRVFVCFSSRSAHRRAIGFSTLTPKPMQTKVAIVYPKIPESMLGMKYARHPLATHMAAAVVGPPDVRVARQHDFLSRVPQQFSCGEYDAQVDEDLQEAEREEEGRERDHLMDGATAAHCDDSQSR